MRNLKRALSLAVASVMLVGMMVVGTGASYADVTSEENQEAIEVLQAVGIMTGDDEGNFNPDQNVTRNEMAVIMCNLMDYTVSSYAGTAPFTDVPSWAEPYVAACWTHSITGGTSATTYGGDESVTTSQAALMLMKALGYFQYQSDFGSDWQVATVSKGSQIGIFDDIDTAAAEALTRNDVAQMVLNALEADMVVATGDGGTTITGDGFQITTGSATYEERTSSDSNYGRIDDERSTNNNRYIIQLGEDLYDGDLRKNGSTDDFGRPSTRWTYNNSEIGTYADGADAVAVMDEDGHTVAEAVTDADYLNYNDRDVLSDAVVWFNGYNMGEYADLDSNSTLIGAGDILQAYEDEDGDVDTIVIARYIAAEIDEIDDDLSSTYTRRGASYAVNLTNVDSASIPAGPFYDAYDSDSDMVMKGFNANTYTEGTVLAVAFQSNGSGDYENVVLDSYVAGQLTTTISSYTDDYVVADGDRYYYAEEIDGVTPGSVTYNDEDDYEIYTTSEGYAIAIVGAGLAALDDVYYVTGVYGTSSNYGGTNYYVQAVNVMTGVASELQLENVDVPTDSSDRLYGLSSREWSNTDRGLYILTDNRETNAAGITVCSANNDKYNARVFTGNSDWDVHTGASYNGNLLQQDVESDSTAIRLYTNASGNTARYYFKDNTSFVAAEDDQDDLEVSVTTGVMTMAAGDPDWVAVITESGSNDASYVVFAGADLGSAVASDSIVYVAKNQDFDTNTRDDTTNAALWFMETMTEEASVLDGTYGKSDKGFYTYSVDDDGVYDLTDDAPAISATIDDEDGVLENVVVNENNYNENNHLLYGVSYFDDTRYGDARIIDTRSSSDKNEDVYTGTISTVSAFERAMSRGDVTIDVYVEDGDILFIAIVDVENATPSQGGGDGEPGTVSGDNMITTDYASGVQRDEIADSLVAGETYIFTDVDAVNALANQGLNGEPEENLFFFFRGHAANEDITLVIRNANGGEVYRETITAGASPLDTGCFYIQILGDGVNNAGTGPLKNAPLSVGEYTWTITSANDNVNESGAFTVE